MKLFSGVANIGFGLLVGAFAWLSLYTYLVGNKEKVDRYEALFTQGISVVATLDSTYEETHFKIKGIEVNLYKMGYKFMVDSVNYRGSSYFDHPDSIPAQYVEIMYLKSDPTINEANVEKELILAREQIESDDSLNLGIGSVVLSILLLFIGIRKVKRGLSPVREYAPVKDL
jgi:hypothetical protein